MIVFDGILTQSALDDGIGAVIYDPVVQKQPAESMDDTKTARCLIDYVGNHFTVTMTAPYTDTISRENVPGNDTILRMEVKSRYEETTSFYSTALNLCSFL